MGWNDLIGRTIGSYEIIEELGRGGTARVYRAYQDALQRYVAIKVLLNDAEDRLGFVRRFQRELEAVSKLNHPNIVAVYEADELEDLVYLVMQCVNGGTFRQRLGQPLPVAEACGAVIQVARALQHAHSHGIIHRDVKPSNMLIDSDNDGRILLTDFGIAKLAGMGGLTKSGTTMGTPEYMAPEQAEGREIDARADVYSLGCVLYEALAGRAPFVGPSPVSVLYHQVHVKPDHIRMHNPEVPRELARIIDMALAKQPEQRFSSADSFAWALHPFTIVRERGVLSGPVLGSTAQAETSLGGLDLRTGARSGTDNLTGNQAVDSSGELRMPVLPPELAGEGTPDEGLGKEGLDALFPDDPEASVAKSSSLRAPNSRPLDDGPAGYLPGSSLVAEIPLGDLAREAANPRPTVPLVPLATPLQERDGQSLDLPLKPDGVLDITALMRQVHPVPEEELQELQELGWAPPPDLPQYEDWKSAEEVAPYTAWTAPPPADDYDMAEDLAEYPVYAPIEPELVEVPSLWGDVHHAARAQMADAVSPPPIWRPEEPEARPRRTRKLAPVPPRRGPLIAVLAAVVMVLALSGWAVVGALGHGAAPGVSPSATKTAVSQPTATPTAIATPTPAATATLTRQQQLDRQAAAAFRGVTLAPRQVDACSAPSNVMTFARADAIWVNLCLAQSAPSGQVSVALEQAQRVIAVLGRTWAQPGHSYAWAYYASNLAPGSYHVVVTFNNGTAADIPLAVQ